MQKDIMWDELILFQDELEPDTEDNDEELDSHNHMLEQMMKISQVQVTPLGLVEVNTDNHPLRGIPFFIGITNFDVTAKNILDINDVPGVEFLERMTRYRFVVGIGQLFEPMIVLAEIEKTLGIVSVEQSITNNHPVVQEAKKKLDKKYGEGNWIAYMYPNGKIEEREIKTDIDMDEAISRFMNLKELSGGEIFS